MTTILDCLVNAEYILKKGIAVDVGMSQLRMAIVLLEKGYDPFLNIEPILDEYENVELVPEQLDPSC